MAGACKARNGAGSGVGVWVLVERSIVLGNTIALAGAAGFASDVFDIITATNLTTAKPIPTRGCGQPCGGGMILDIWADERNGIGGAFVSIFESIDTGGQLFTEGRLIQPSSASTLRWSTRVTGPTVKFVVTNMNAAAAIDVQLGIYLRNR